MYRKIKNTAVSLRYSRNKPINLLTYISLRQTAEAYFLFYPVFIYYYSMLQNQHLLIICTVWPESRSSAAGSRMMQLIALFLNRGCKITIACDANESEYSDDLSVFPIDKIAIELNNSKLDSQLKQLNPSVVLFDRFMTEEKYGWRVTEQCPEAIKILDTEDLHCLRKARQNALQKGENFRDAHLINDVSKREIASIYRCDLSLIISPYEMEILQSFFKIDPAILHYIPFLLEPVSDKDISKWSTFSKRMHFISIGNFLHAPNSDAVFFLKEEIWPIIRKALPEAELHIYGAYAPEKIIQLHNTKQGFFIKGRADNASKVIREARVLIAPLRFGAGIKGKLTEAMQCGTPSVTTSIGAEGMHGSYPWSGFVANNAKETAQYAIDLYTNEVVWQKCQTNGITIINGFYEKDRHSIKFIERLLWIQQGIKTHREANFMGAILLHHTLSGTKYMSKWIELKNKS